MKDPWVKIATSIIGDSYSVALVSVVTGRIHRILGMGRTERQAQMRARAFVRELLRELDRIIDGK